MSDAVEFLVSDWLPVWLESMPDELWCECPIRTDWLRGCTSTGGDGATRNPHTVTVALKAMRKSIGEITVDAMPDHHTARLYEVADTAASTRSGADRIAWSADGFVGSKQWGHFKRTLKYICMYTAADAIEGVDHLKNRSSDAVEEMREACLEMVEYPRYRARKFAKQQIESGVESPELEALAAKPIDD